MTQIANVVHGAANVHDLLELRRGVVAGLLSGSTSAFPCSLSQQRPFERSYSFGETRQAHDRSLSPSIRCRPTIALHSTAKWFQSTVSGDTSSAWPHFAHLPERDSTTSLVSSDPICSRCRCCRKSAFVSFVRHSGNFLRFDEQQACSNK